MMKFLFSFTCLILSGSGIAASAERPNIIYILADDMGIGDVSCYNENAKLSTTHIDRLAAEGMRFTDAHTPSAALRMAVMLDR